MLETALAPILLVDDQPENLMVMEAQLDDMDDIDIVQAGSGEEALRQLLTREFALVLLDIQMPGMDGFETAARIRAHANTSQVPIIFVTGSASGVQFESLGYEYGAVDYLVKPVEPVMLRTKVQVFAKLYHQRQAVAEHARYMEHVAELVAKRTGYQQSRDDRLRVLLVDDRPENLLALEALLADLDDLILVKVNSGPEALRAVLRDEFAVILLDVQMPGMDGFETAELIHTNPKTAKIPIIFVTAGLKERDSLVHGYEQGAFDYLIKPLEPAIVKSKVRVFCDMYLQRMTIEKQNTYLEVLTADRTAALQKATTELSENLANYRRLAEKLDLATRAGDLGIWDWSVVTNELVWDARMAELYGLGKANFDKVYETWLAALHPDDRERCDTAVKQALANEKPYDIEFRIYLPDGAIRHIKADGMVTFDADGKPQRMTGINYDITERKRNEEELRQLTERLEVRVEEKTRQLSKAMEQIFESEKLASLGGIVAGVSHELSTPIGNVLMTASTLEEKISAVTGHMANGSLTRSAFNAAIGECKDITTILVRNALRANKLIESFKNVAVDQSSIRRRVFDLREVTIDIFNTLEMTMRRANVSSDIRIPAGIAMDSFPGDLEQIFTNLIVNSIQHGFERRGSGHIVIDGSRRQESIEIVYRDDGAGIAPELHRRIFEPFFTTRLGQGGSGLGMFIVHNLVHGSLRGDIELESKPGEGVRFAIVVPAVTPTEKPHEAS